MSFTSSFHHGTDVCRGHNLRDENHKDEAHIDENGLHETWIDEPIEKAYERLFGEALKEYNEKQKRADRKIKSYLQNVRQNSKLNDCYEFITQVGNEKIHPSADVSKAILKEYLASFQERNPGLEVIGAYFHADEVGTCPHLHTDYIPVAKGNKTGLKVRNNLNSALKALGYETEFKDGRMISAEMKFQEAEREALNSICRNHGLDIENPNRKDYCSSQQLREARNVRLQNEIKSAEMDKREEELKSREAEAQRVLQQQRALEIAQAEFEKSKKESEEFAKSLDEPVKPLPELENISNIGSAERLEENFPTEKTGTFSRENPYEYANRMTNNVFGWFKNKFYEPLKDKCNKLLQAVKDLKRDNELKKARIDTLERENRALNQSVDKIVDDRLKSRSTALIERAKAEAEAPLKKRLQGFENFMDGQKTTFTINGQNYTCLSGVNTIKNVFEEVEALESITPTGLKNLAKICEARGFETVGDAEEYRKKQGLNSVFDISERPRSQGFSMGR